MYINLVIIICPQFARKCSWIARQPTIHYVKVVDFGILSKPDTAVHLIVVNIIEGIWILFGVYLELASSPCNEWIEDVAQMYGVDIIAGNSA